jgi:PHD/YefM family antitoxin component YafN of YafNO toxin-antitoxin module
MVINPALVETPVIAESAPWIVRLVVVTAPALVTRNGAEEAVLLPAKNGNVPGRSPTADAPVPAVSDVELRVKPPMVPADAEIEPVLVTLNGAADPVVAPSQSL